MHVYVCLCIHLCVLNLSLCVHICLSVYLSVSFFLSVCLSVCLPVSLSPCPSTIVNQEGAVSLNPSSGNEAQTFVNGTLVTKKTVLHHVRIGNMLHQYGTFLEPLLFFCCSYWKSTCPIIIYNQASFFLTFFSHAKHHSDIRYVLTILTCMQGDMHYAPNSP